MEPAKAEVPAPKDDAAKASKVRCSYMKCCGIVRSILLPESTFAQRHHLGTPVHHLVPLRFLSQVAEAPAARPAPKSGWASLLKSDPAKKDEPAVPAKEGSKAVVEPNTSGQQAPATPQNGSAEVTAAPKAQPAKEAGPETAAEPKAAANAEPAADAPAAQQQATQTVAKAADGADEVRPQPSHLAFGPPVAGWHVCPTRSFSVCTRIALLVTSSIV